MGKHRKATIVSRTVNTVRTSTHAVKAGVMKLKFWGKAPVAEVEQGHSDAFVASKVLIAEMAEAQGNNDHGVFADDVDEAVERLNNHAEPTHRTAAEQAAVDARVETRLSQLDEWNKAKGVFSPEAVAAGYEAIRLAVAARSDDDLFYAAYAAALNVDRPRPLDLVHENTERMVKHLQDAAAEIKPITVKPVTAEDIAEVMASVVPVKAAKPGLVKRAAKAVGRPFRRTTKVVSTETVDTNVVEIADHLKGLTEFRALCSDGGETPCGWVTVYAVDRKAARRFVTDHASGIASALFVLGGNPEITLHTGPFGIEAWEHRYPLGRRDFYIVRAVKAA